MTPLKLDCPGGDYIAMCDALDRTRNGTHTVKVPKEGLKALLFDHSRVLARLEALGERVEHFPGRSST